LRKLSSFGASFGFVRSAQVTRNGLFFLERKPGSDVYDLVVRQLGRPSKASRTCWRWMPTSTYETTSDTRRFF